LPFRFLLDEDISPEVGHVARNLGLDVISVYDVGRDGLDDETQLKYAASEQHIFVTRNRNDFLELTLEFARLGVPHCGVLIAPFTIPASRPEPLARVLVRWVRAMEDRYDFRQDPASYFIDFLPAAWAEETCLAH
jgi:predicted nuclease of predicted toxin-antitoxin system